MKKLLLLLLAPLLLVSCSSDDDDVDNPDGFLAKNDGVVFLENIGPDEYYAFFWIFSPSGYTQGEIDPEDTTSCYSSGFQPWNVEIPGQNGGFDKYEVTHYFYDAVNSEIDNQQKNYTLISRNMFENCS